MEYTPIQPTPMRFKVELQLQNMVITEIYHAVTLQSLFEQIQDSHPDKKILSIIGGGT